MYHYKIKNQNYVPINNDKITAEALTMIIIQVNKHNPFINEIRRNRDGQSYILCTYANRELSTK